MKCGIFPEYIMFATKMELINGFVKTLFNEMKFIMNNNNLINLHKSCRKYKSENGRTRTSEYIKGGIRCLGGVSITCREPYFHIRYTVRIVVNISVSKTA
jgi:hypothetical protein